MTKRRTILISGASIAGPALAYWCHAAGMEVTVVERAPAPRPGGQAVDLRGVGRTIVERMGLLQRARDRRLDQRGIVWVDAGGRIKAAMGADDFGGEGIISEIEILRDDLVDMLIAETRHDVDYRFDDTITGLSGDGDGVDVTFETAPPQRFDFVVGADGLHSAVRRLAFGPEQDCVHPLGLYTAWFTAPALPELDGWYQMYNHRGGLVASIRPGRDRTESKASLSFRVPPEQPLTYDRRDVDAQRALLAERFTGVGWRVPWLLEAARSAPDLAFDSTGQVKIDRWSNGRIALIGDAAACPSPLTGLGTSVALAGAYVLAGELGRLASGADPGTAMHRYEQTLRPFVSDAQQIPGGGPGGYAPMSGLTITLAQASMRWASRWPFRPMMARQFAKSDNIRLADYEFPVRR